MVAMTFERTVRHDRFTTFIGEAFVPMVMNLLLTTGYRESDIKIWKCDSEGNRLPENQ